VLVTAIHVFSPSVRRGWPNKLALGLDPRVRP
jgi:hypothetical protein